MERHSPALHLQKRMRLRNFKNLPSYEKKKTVCDDLLAIIKKRSKFFLKAADDAYEHELQRGKINFKRTIYSTLSTIEETPENKSQDEELDYDYDDKKGCKNAKDDAYSSYHHQDSRRRKRSHHQYADDDEEENDENEGEEEYEDKTYDDDENCDRRRHNSLSMSNDSHIHSKKADIALMTLSHTDLDKEDVKDNNYDNDAEEKFEVPVPGRLKKFHDIPCHKENSVEGSVAEDEEIELYSKKLISDMFIVNKNLNSAEYWRVSDKWKNEYNSPVQIPSRTDRRATNVRLVERNYKLNKFQMPSRLLTDVTQEPTNFYDLDLLDEVWLKGYNKMRNDHGLDPISEDQFELVMEGWSNASDSFVTGVDYEACERIKAYQQLKISSQESSLSSSSAGKAEARS